MLLHHVGRDWLDGLLRNVDTFNAHDLNLSLVYDQNIRYLVWLYAY